MFKGPENRLSKNLLKRPGILKAGQASKVLFRLKPFTNKVRSVNGGVRWHDVPQAIGRDCAILKIGARQ